MADIELQKEAAVFGSGSEKPTKADDPLQMRADFVAGDQRVMLQCLIEEFAHIGWNANQITRMFENPFFLASHGLTKRFGSETVRETIEQSIKSCGIFRCAISESKSIPEPQTVTISASGESFRRAKIKSEKVNQKKINSGTLNGDRDYV